MSLAHRTLRAVRSSRTTDTHVLLLWSVFPMRKVHACFVGLRKLSDASCGHVGKNCPHLRSTCWFARRVGKQLQTDSNPL